MAMIDIQEISSRVPLFSGLDPEDLQFVLRVARRVEFAKGSLLVRQGQAADSALVMEYGRASVVNVLPGGGEAVMAELGPGSVLGEMALLDSGVRSANVIAREHTACLSMERDAFRMLIAQGNRAVLAINHRIMLGLCQRLRDLNGKILAHSTPEHLAPAVAKHHAQRQPCAFDYRPFLTLLPAFRHFSSDALDELQGAATVFDLPRGAVLFNAGDDCDAAYVVIRGALEISREQDGAHRRIGILGPGRLCGLLALIENTSHSMSASAREHATLMEIPQAVFAGYYNGSAHAALKFQQAINQELLQALARTNNHLTRLISQARIRNHGQHVDTLGHALLAQDCRLGMA
jgi:CRP/FNR family cyclic AMP-dependent transcriptional regulator